MAMPWQPKPQHAALLALPRTFGTEVRRHREDGKPGQFLRDLQARPGLVQFYYVYDKGRDLTEYVWEEQMPGTGWGNE